MPKQRILFIRQSHVVSDAEDEVVTLAYNLWRAAAFRGVSPEDALFTAVHQLGVGTPFDRPASPGLFLVPKPDPLRPVKHTLIRPSTSFERVTVMKRLLLLEDEFPVMKLLRQILKQCRLIEATTAQQALRLFTEHDRQVDLLLADVSLPTSSGIQVALLLRLEVPDLPVILTSGYPVCSWSDRDSADLERLGSKTVTILQKPFQAQVLLGAVRELTGEPQTERTMTA